MLNDVTTQPSSLTALLNGDSLESRIAAYRNTAEHNDAIYTEFTRLLDSFQILKEHRDWYEAHPMCCGDRAFHYLWLLILQHLATIQPKLISLMEVGVFKGQSISLWALCVQKLNLDVRITAISLFTGNRPKRHRYHMLQYLLFPGYRKMYREGNLYPKTDYLELCESVFNKFKLPFSIVRPIKGNSADPAIVAQVKDEQFDLVYIDGDHTYEGCRADILHYAPLVRPEGILVMDDASCGLPGTVFWKGWPAVSRAAEIIPSMGFVNVLNMGLIRVYIRRK